MHAAFIGLRYRSGACSLGLHHNGGIDFQTILRIVLELVRWAEDHGHCGICR